MTDSTRPIADPRRAPLVATAEMGHGHVRAARALADACGVPLVHVDRPPLAGAADAARWRRARLAYEATSRLSQVPVVGAPLRWLLDGATEIPHLHPFRDLSAPSGGARALDRLVRRGLGQGLVEELRRSGRPLLTTFYAPAIVADRAGIPAVYCVVTDTDVNRVWVPVDARATRIRYLVPTHRAGRRLQAYGVPAERITFTGFPLPHELVGGPGLEPLLANLAARLVRLDPQGTFRREQGEALAHFLGRCPGARRARAAGHVRRGRRGRPGRPRAGVPPVAAPRGARGEAQARARRRRATRREAGLRGGAARGPARGRDWRGDRARCSPQTSTGTSTR